MVQGKMPILFCSKIRDKFFNMLKFPFSYIPPISLQYDLRKVASKQKTAFWNHSLIEGKCQPHF